MVRFEMNDEEADMVLAVMKQSSHPAKDCWIKFMRNRRSECGSSAIRTITDEDLTEEALAASAMGNYR